MSIISTFNELAPYIEEDQPNKPEDFRTPREKQLESSEAGVYYIYIYMKIINVFYIGSRLK